MSSPFLACASLAHLPPLGSWPIPASTNRPLDATAAPTRARAQPLRQGRQLPARLLARVPQSNRAVARARRAQVRAFAHRHGVYRAREAHTRGRIR